MLHLSECLKNDGWYTKCSIFRSKFIIFFSALKRLCLLYGTITVVHSKRITNISPSIRERSHDQRGSTLLNQNSNSKIVAEKLKECFGVSLDSNEKRYNNKFKYLYFLMNVLLNSMRFPLNSMRLPLSLIQLLSKLTRLPWSLIKLPLSVLI